jgi:glycine/D-amino acid oxidase-like deaminating enzyme
VSASPPSFWLDQLPPREPRAPLRGSREADVCVVGGGLTGLWTAYELRRADPQLEVVVLEAERIGFGASGRSGGLVLGGVLGGGELGAWERRGGAGAARTMALALRDTVAQIGEMLVREQIECDWRAGGALVVAQTPAQLQRLRAERERELSLGGEELARRLLDPEQLRARVNVSGALGALYTPHGARVQPARLAAGLAEAAERAGAVVFEGSRVRALAPGSVQTDEGSVRARHLVLATEAYSAELPGLHRRLLALSGGMLVTEPLPGEAWELLGWSEGEALLDAAHLYSYAQRTADGRIALGVRGVEYRPRPGAAAQRAVRGRSLATLRARLGFLFPSLAGGPIARSWQGVLGLSREGLPSVGLDHRSGIAHAGGYAGGGLAASNLAGRTLRDLILGHDSDLARLPWVGPAPRDWGPRPLRAFAARELRRLYRSADRRELRTGRSSVLADLADRVGGG